MSDYTGIEPIQHYLESLDFLLKFTEKVQKILQFMAEKTDPSFSWLTPHIARFNEIYFLLINYYSSHPNQFWELQAAIWQQLFSVNDVGNREDESQLMDKRFRDPVWNWQPLFVFIKQSYFLAARYLHSMVMKIDSIDEKTKRQMDFYLTQFIDAYAPTNFLFTNPEAIRITLQTNGKNILAGLDHVLEDLNRSGDFLQIKMTNLDAFKVGENVAVTPGKIIYQNDLMQLIQYSPQTPEVFATPLLIIPPWINKYYILDLSQQKSLVKWLVEQGYTIFMISWVNPSQQHANKNFSDYMLEGPLAALDAIEKAIGVHEINALGFCIGGTLLACTLAYLAAQKDKRIKSGTYLATMLDFSEPGDLGNMLHETQLKYLERDMHAHGFYDGKKMAQTFNLLRANDLIWSYYVKNYLLGEEPPAFDLLYWNSDSTNLPEAMQRFYLHNMYLNNNLIKAGEMILNGVPINLRNITIPVFFVSTQLDHIAPWQSTYAGTHMHAGPVTFVLGRSGHIAGIVNPPALTKYGFYTNENLTSDPADWLKSATEQPGSWWTYWEKWLRSKSGAKTAARLPGANGTPILDDAPGSYVLMKC